MRHLLLAGLVAVLAMVLLSFGRMMWIGYELSQRAEEMRDQIAWLEDEGGQLRAELEYLQTDEATEELAREKLGWARPGDTVLIVSSEEPRPRPAAKIDSLTRSAPEKPIWQKWWQALVGRPDAGPR